MADTRKRVSEIGVEISSSGSTSGTYAIEAPYVEINATNKVAAGGAYVLDENGQATLGFDKKSGFVVSEDGTKFGSKNLYIKTVTI